MNERESLLKRLSAAQFAAWETHLYLDTHTDDCQAMQARERYRAQYRELLKEYEEKYGPLSAGSAQSSSDWLADPWPWDICKEAQ